MPRDSAETGKRIYVFLWSPIPTAGAIQQMRPPFRQMTSQMFDQFVMRWF
jgi:hypothetical protein